MIQVKFCGITNEEDAICAANFGAAALGFIFYFASLRFIEPPAARKIISKLPHHIARVGVFVNESAAEIKRVIKHCGLDFIQLHGDESTEFCHNFPTPKIIKAVCLKNEDDVERALEYNVAALLVDSRYGGCYGGTGIVADWNLAHRTGAKKPIILSGGLNQKNIRQAIETVAPHAVDVNSGVEISPGRKDLNKMAHLMDIVKKTSLNDDKVQIFMKR